MAFALALALANSLASADAATPEGSAPPAVVVSTATTQRPAAVGVRYTVVLDAPDALQPMLQEAVDLVRWQYHEDMTPELFDRLAREALRQVRDAAAAEGWFSAAVAITVDRTTDPETVTLTIDAGERTRIATVQVVVTGPAVTDVPAGTDAIASARRDWSLPVGAAFRQPLWDAAKRGAVATLAAAPYVAAKITTSEASIDPDAATADLDLTIESGPAFRFGALAITGLRRYEAALVQNFSPIHPGDAHSASELARYVRRLNGSGYFASVQASIDPDPAQADHATVNVAVIEGQTRRLELGIGYSTDTQIRANLDYRDVNVDDRALQMFASARMETKVQNAALRFVRPPNAGGWLDSAGAKVERTDIEDLVTETAAVAVRREGIDETDRWAFGLAYLVDRQSPSGAPASEARALFADVTRTWRRTDDLVAPARGYNVNLQVGAGIPGASTAGFGRFIAQAAAWYPFGQVNEISARAQFGAVVTDSREDVPSTLLFRTGGDTTVRGYEFDSIGVKNGDATVPGRYLAVASVEAMRWFGESWGLAAFVDAGNAVDDLADLKHLAVGYGVGLRLKTPIGPFRFDVAYGEDTRRVRIHFSVGLSF